jgi:hypothetical protein
MAAQAEWTWLVYMAGDNNLEGAGREDLQEMQQVGSTPQVNVIVQFDTEENKTTRFRVERDRLSALQEMPGVDSGDPRVLRDFIRWGSQQFPARHYLVDVWNHGGGWENLPADYNYDSIRAAKPNLAKKLQRVKRSLFRTTVARIHQRPPDLRAIAIDCGAHDYLDNQELRDAVAGALPGGAKVDILGCDACLMNMLEIGYEMKDTSSLMVGSEETEPGAGWPYTEVLQALTGRPTMGPAELARTIVADYGRWYRLHGNPVYDKAATQSALDLGRLPPLADAVNALADVLRQDLNRVAGAVSLSRDRAQKFEYPEYVDLGDFVEQLAARLPDHGPVQTAVAQLRPALSQFVIENATWGASVGRATGVSIYFPHPEDYAPDYGDLAYSREGRWRQFLEAFFAA